MLPPLAGPLHNWAGNVTFTPTELIRPTEVSELQELVASSRRIRALGSGHSFNRIVDTDGVLVAVRDLAGGIEIDAETGAATVPAGATYAVVGAALQEAGRALHNTGSLPHIAVAGACATGTHGSGNTNRNLPTAVSAVEFVDATGELVTLSRSGNPDVFGGAVLALGALGIVTRITLDTQPTYDVRQDLWQDVPFERLLAEVDDVMASAYSVSVFTDWSRPDVVDKVWTKSRVDAFTDHPDDWLGGRRAAEPQHPIVGEDTAGATEQLGVPGPWNARLPHFRIEFTPSSGEEIQAEYLLPREHTAAALVALRGLADRFPGVLMVFELRTIAADDLWLSPSHGRDTVGLHFTWVRDIDRVRPVLGAIEAAIADLSPRPHWGKVATIPDDVVRAAYPRLADFTALVARFDPEDKFGNAFTARYLQR
ncbi:FAD-binding protein [Jatrophihabitans sp. YIM 134969]